VISFTRSLEKIALQHKKWLRLFGQSFLGINKVTALQFQAAIAAPVLMK